MIPLNIADTVLGILKSIAEKLYLGRAPLFTLSVIAVGLIIIACGLFPAIAKLFHPYKDDSDKDTHDDEEGGLLADH